MSGGSAEWPSELDAGLADLGRVLQPALIGVLSDGAFRERTLQWLSSNDGWLLVPDNVSAPADLKPLDLYVLEPAEAVELFRRVLVVTASALRS